MKKTCTRLLALGVVLALAGTAQPGTAHAGAPPVTSLLLPQLFGQDAGPAPSAQRQDAKPDEDSSVPSKNKLTVGFSVKLQQAEPKAETPRKQIVVPTSEMDDDADFLTDLILDSLSACRMVLVPSRFEGVADLVEALARVATLKHGEVKAAATTPATAPSCPKPAATGPCCEMLHSPKVVSGPGCSPWAIGCGAAVCDKPASYASGPNTFAVDKACKCCESCKDCQCGKKAGAGTSSFGGSCGSIVINERNFSVQPSMPSMTCMPAMPQRTAAPCQPLLMHLLPPNAAFHPMPNAPGMPHPMLPPPPPPQLVRALIGETPTCLMAELHELIQQRDMIAHAIDQVEMEIAHLAQQKQMEQAQVAATLATPAAQKVHLVTKNFEAHCDSLYPVGGAPNCMVLQGNVRLTCKKGGQTIRIEAPCISINVQDGTFNVDELRPVSCPAVPVGVQSCPAPAVAPVGVALPSSSRNTGSGR